MMSNNWPEDMQPCPHCGKTERIEQISDQRDDILGAPEFNGGMMVRMPQPKLRCGSCGFETAPWFAHELKDIWNRYPAYSGRNIQSDSAKTIGGGE